MGIEQLMSHSVSSVPESARLDEAATVMASADVSCVAVLDADQKLVGLITERDITRSVADGIDPKTTPVIDRMASIVITIEVSESTETVAQIMVDLGVRHLPVTQGGRVIGIISARDLLERSENG